MKSTIKRHNFKDDHDDDNHDEYDDNNNNRTTLECHHNKGKAVTPFKYIFNGRWYSYAFTVFGPLHFNASL